MLRAILDHRLLDPNEDAYWTHQLWDFARAHQPVKFSTLSEAHKTFCATGTLSVSYLYFLWRELDEIWEKGVFERLLQTMCKHGILFTKLGSTEGGKFEHLLGTKRKELLGQWGSTRNVDAFGVASNTALFVPVRLKSVVEKDELRQFSAPCVAHQWRRQLVFDIHQSYVPPGIIGMIMSRLLCSSDVQLHCAWRRGISFMMGGSEVMSFLNSSHSQVGRAEIDVNIVGPKHSEEVEAKVITAKYIVEDVLSKNFPGLPFNLQDGVVRTLEGEDALMNSIVSLRTHLDVKLELIEEQLVDVARKTREGIMRLKSLQATDCPYPHLVVIGEATPGSKVTGRLKKSRFKALFKSLSSRARGVAVRRMTLYFRCPFDHSDVPCGPNGEGYTFGEARDWVKRLMPALQVRPLLATVPKCTLFTLDVSPEC